MRSSILRKTFIWCAVLVTAFVSVSLAEAQGRYANVYSKRDVSGIINKLEQSSNTFRSDFDRYLDQSTMNGTSEETRLNRIVSDYERALNRLRKEYDGQDDWWQSRRNVEDVMSSARAVNNMMNSLTFARQLERQWRNMRTDLNKLADTYDLPSLENTGGTGNVPNWAVGTFYGRSPENGATVSITITESGAVTANFPGSITYGSFINNRLYISGAEARVTRLNNGIRTPREDNGYTIDYYRTGNSSDGGGVGGNVPSWALGTFYGQNPETGGTITLTINRNGSVTADFQGSVTSGTYRNDRLFISGAEARVTRIDNGIRTRRVDNGYTIDYYRSDNSGGGGNGRVPNWAVGTFYGRNPENGENITLTINANGTVRADFPRSSVNGTYRNERLYISGEEARVRQTNNGIRTTNVSTGQSIDYYRTPQGGGGNANVPSWALGTFYGRNPENGGTILLTISRDGSVTADFQGSVTYGTFRNNRIYISGAEAQVSRLNNGIRTMRTDNGYTIDYYRR